MLIQFRAGLLPAAALSVTLLPLPASAAVMQIIYEGKVTGVSEFVETYDYITGKSGGYTIPHDPSERRTPITITVTYDTEAGVRTTTHGSGPYVSGSDSLDGGIIALAVSSVPLTFSKSEFSETSLAYISNSFTADFGYPPSPWMSHYLELGDWPSFWSEDGTQFIETGYFVGMNPFGEGFYHWLGKAQPYLLDRPDSFAIPPYWSDDQWTSLSQGAITTTYSGSVPIFREDWSLNVAYNIERITITTLDPISPVPLPAAGVLLVAGLAGLGFVGRRRG